MINSFVNGYYTHWFSAGIAELADIARRWQAAEPDNERCALLPVQAAFALR